MSIRPNLDVRNRALCFAAAMVEGFDLQALGVAAPSMAAAFGFSPAQMGMVFSSSLVGLLIGAMTGGWLADRYGRKWVLLSSMLLFGLFTFGTAAAFDFTSMLAVRIAAGLGLGGAMPTLIALAAESVSEQRRATAVSMMYAGVPIGAAIAGVVVMQAPAEWRMVFYIGGLMPVVIAVLMVRGLHEAAHVARQQAKTAGFWFSLFGEKRTIPTILLWGALFFTVMVLYLIINWLPLLMVGIGFDKANAAGLLVLFSIGGGIGSWWIGPVMDRGYRNSALMLTYLILALAIGALALVGHLQIVAAMASFLVGTFILAAQVGLYGLMPDIYPVTVRGTGSGMAVAMGRLGSIAGPLMAGQILTAGHDSRMVLLAIEPVIFISGVAALLLLRHQRLDAAQTLFPAGLSD
ncbi:MAG: 3-(3-hydroxy-phenyl)propionate transporter MhpT [Steroidobacteraceae bacterium]